MIKQLNVGKKVYVLFALVSLLGVAMYSSLYGINADQSENDELSNVDIMCQKHGWPKRGKPGKIYDFFFTNNEAMWWDIRLNTLYPVVDAFFILESKINFNGKSKPLFFKENIAKFSKFKDKIHHFVLESDIESGDVWNRESYQRDMLFVEGFKKLNLKENDIILLSDTDEIPKPEALLALRYCMPPPRITLQSNIAFYSFEYVTGTWDHPQAMLYNKADIPSAQTLRNTFGSVIPNSSWSCSYCFDKISDFQYKLESFAHQELNTDFYKDPKKILDHISKGTRFFQDPIQFQFVEKPDMPKYVKENDKYRYLYDRHMPSGGFSNEELAKYGLDQSR